MMYYVQNQHSNLLQVITGYLAYADNVFKQTAKILHQIELFITLETVRKALSANVAVIYAELQNKV